MNHSARRLCLAFITPVAAALAACSGAEQPPPAALGAAAPLYDSLPDTIKKAGKIKVGSDISYAPMEYYDTDGTTVLGLDKDLTDLMAKQLGVPFEWQNATFDGLVPQLQTNRIDMAMSGMSDTRERQKQVDFIDYYRAGAMLLVKKGNPLGLNSLADLCGKTVAVQRGTTAGQLAQQQSDRCTSEGAGAIEILPFDRETEALLQVKSGRAASGLEDYQVAVYNARTSGGGNDFEVAGEQVDAGPLGMAVAKTNNQLRDAIRSALQNAIDDGTYKETLEKYGVPLGAVPTAEINQGE